MNYKLEWEGSNPIVSIEGILNFERMNAADEAIYGDQRLDTMKYQLWDLRKITQVDLLKEEITIVGVLDRSASCWNNDVKVISVTDNKKIIELTETYNEQLESTNWKAYIFSDMDEAIAFRDSLL